MKTLFDHHQASEITALGEKELYFGEISHIQEIFLVDLTVLTAYVPINR